MTEHRNHLEPSAIDIHPLSEAALFSIAVSLKRIADSFDDPLFKVEPSPELRSLAEAAVLSEAMKPKPRAKRAPVKR